ncbi:MAG: hypothetical protein EPN92_05415 [Chitinophagaceae bacterium]|nr:MAG: hypothetical protein EPN92_05415 [Chitinophagaceae bacterium]
MSVRKENKTAEGKGFFVFIAALLFPVFLFSQTDSVVVDSAAITEQYNEDTTGEGDEVNYFFRNDEGPEQQQVSVRRIPDSVTNAYRNDNAFWYANKDWNKPQQKQESGVQEPFFRQAWFRMLMWIIITGCFIAVVIWYLSLNDVGIFRRKKVSIANAEEEVPTENIFDINYTKEINKAVADGNYRFAVRLMFLRVLKNLSEKEIISYKQDRTNFDYLLQLQQTNYYKDFFRLTRNYEYTWYGQFDMSTETFSLVKKDFENFNYRLN